MATNEDTAAIMRLTRHADKMRFKAPDSSLALFQQALGMSRAVNYTDGIARSLLGMATLYIDRGDLNAGVNILNMARPACEKSTYRNGMYLIYLNKNMAAIYVQKNILDTAAAYYFEALRQYDLRKSTDTSLRLSLYSNLGAMWVDDGQYDVALKYLMEARDIALKTRDEKQLSEIYTNIAAAYSGNRLYDTAITYGNMALVYARKSGYTYMEACASYEMGTFYAYKNQPAAAIAYYEDALKPEDNIPAYLELNVNTGLGEAYYSLKKYRTAEEYYFKVLNMTEASNYEAALVSTYNDLATLYEDTKNYKAALKYKELASSLKDSTLTAEKIKTTTQMEVKFRMAEKNKELAQNQLQLTQQESIIKQKNIWVNSILIGVVLLSALSFTIYRGEKRKRKLQQIQIADMRKEQQIAELKARLDGEEEERIRIAQELHDGIMVQFSSVKMNLSVVLDRASDPKERYAIDKIVMQLDNATRELRKSAHNLMPDMLLEEGLTEAVYYFLSELKQSSGVEIEFQQYGDLPVIATEYELMLYRMVQELTQNAIKHSHATHILVQLNYRGNMLSLTVEDDGVGFKPGATQAPGIGLRNIQSRVSSLQGTIEIKSEPGVGSTIYIEFDISYLQKKS